MTTPEPLLAKPPSEMRRAIWVFAALGFIIVAVPPSDIFATGWWQQLQLGGLAELMLWIAAATALGLYLGADIRNLRDHQDPLWKDLALYAFAIFFFVAAVIARESGIWIWQFAFVDVFFVVLCTTLTAISLITERRNRVRVYLFARRLVFVHEKPDA